MRPNPRQQIARGVGGPAPDRDGQPQLVDHREPANTEAHQNIAVAGVGGVGKVGFVVLKSVAVEGFDARGGVCAVAGSHRNATL